MKQRLLARRSDEEGAVAIVVAVSMILIAVIAALVLDIGMARLDRTSNTLTADAAVAGGLQTMYSEANPKPWRAVCTALAYVRANGPEMSTVTGSYEDGNGSVVASPCRNVSLQDRTCLPGTLSTWARWEGASGDGAITVSIRSGYTLPDPAFPETAALTGDTDPADKGGCDQLAVIITEARAPGLGSVVSSSDTITQVRSVGRATQGATSVGSAIPALVLLEPRLCDALLTTGNSHVTVWGRGAVPGTIRADSTGSCTSSYVIASKNSSPGVRVKAAAAPTGTPRLSGSITTVATTRSSVGASSTCAETAALVCAATTGRSARSWTD